MNKKITKLAIYLPVLHSIICTAVIVTGVFCSIASACEPTPCTWCCCDWDSCQNCDYTSTVWWCYDRCDPNKCEVCVDRICKRCGGHYEKICCQGSCCDPDSQICCNGCCSSGGCCDDKNCYDPNTEHCCGNGDGKTCPTGNECCGTNCCDPCNCESCVAGSCKVCGGDPNQKCCGSEGCKQKCKNTKPTGACDVNQNEEYKCIYCVGPGAGVGCQDFATRIYTGNINHGCSGGCEGECEPKPDVLCYTEYKCVEKDVLSDWACVVFGSGELGCVGPDMYVFCPRCEKNPDDEGVEYPVTHKACK